MFGYSLTFKILAQTFFVGIGISLLLGDTKLQIDKSNL